MAAGPRAAQPAGTQSELADVLAEVRQLRAEVAALRVPQQRG